MQEKKSFLQNKYVVLLLITGAVYFFLKFVSPLLTPVILAGMFLTLCYPAFDDIQKKTHIKKQYMATAILLLLCTLLIILVWTAGSFLIREMPAWLSNVGSVQESVEMAVEQGCSSIGNFLGVDMSNVSEVLIEQLDVFVENFEVQVLPGVIGGSWGYIKQLFSVIAVLSVTMIATVLFAKDYDAILSRAGAQPGSRMILGVVLKVIRYLATFVKAQLIIMLSIGLLCTVVLLIAGVENGLLFGILAGVLDALPFIGTGIVLIPLAIWNLYSGYYAGAVVCVVLYAACAILREFLEPKLIGQKVGVYPIAILISVYAGLQLFGLWGIVKGPVGLVIIKQIYEAYSNFIDDESQMNYDEEEEIN